MLAYLWDMWCQAALMLAILTGIYLAFGLLRWAIADPRGFAYRLCGHLALAFGGLALLWAAVIGEKWGWLP